MKKLILLVFFAAIPFFSYAAEDEIAHDIRIEVRNLGKGSDGKNIIHVNPVGIKHSHTGHEHNNQIEEMFMHDADAAKNNPKIGIIKPSFHTIHLTTKKNPDSKFNFSSVVVDNDDKNSENNEKVATLFSISQSGQLNCGSTFALLSGPIACQPSLAAPLGSVFNK